jgi:nucleoside-diphosphate-sugar epimerase/predicted dehydrogenase
MSPAGRPASRTGFIGESIWGGSGTVLVLGAGAVVREFYLGAFERLGCLGRVHVADVDPTALAEMKQSRVRGVHVGGIELIRELRDVDRVVVALPNRLHAEACLAALRAGVTTLVEKPVALSAAEHQAVVAESEALGVPVAVGMSRRFTLAFQGLWRFVRDGGVGEITGVDVEDGAEYAWPSETGEPFSPANGGILADMGVHFLDYARLLGGPVRVERYEDDSRGGVEANCEVTARSEAGFPIRMRLSRTRALRNTFVVRGSLGEVEIRRDQFATFVLRRPDGAPSAYRVAPIGAEAAPYGTDFTAAFAEQFRLFLDGRPGARSALGVPLPGAAELLDVTRTVEECYARRKAAPRRTGRPVAVVTGATGFIGGHLVERLDEAGEYDLVLPVRRYRTCAPVARYAAPMPKVDLQDRETVRRLLRGARLVVHLAYGRDGSPAEQLGGTVDATRNVVEAAIEGGAAAVVVLSSMAVFGHPPGCLVDESFPYRPSYGLYGRAKAQMERWCLRRAASSRATRIVVLNPTCVYGPGGRAYTRVPVELARAGLFCWVDGGVGLANVIYIDNLVDAILRAAETEKAHGRRFILNDGWLSWREFLTPLLGELAASVPSAPPRAREARRYQPLGAALRETLRRVAADEEIRHAIGGTRAYRIARPILSGIARRLGQDGPRHDAASPSETPVSAAPPQAPAWLADLFGPTTTRFSAERARMELGWTSTVSIAEGVRRSVDWLEGVR